MEDKNEYEIRKNMINEYINSSVYVPMVKKQLMNILDVPKDEKLEFENILDQLQREGKIYCNNNGKYISYKDARVYRGTYISKSRGFGFVRTEETDMDDIFISSDDNKNAFDGDIVLVKITKSKTDDKRAEGMLERILEHKKDKIVGTIQISKNFAFVKPDDKAILNDIYVPLKFTLNAKNLDKVFVQIDRWPTADRKAEGKVLEIIGDMYTPNIEEKSVLKQFGIDIEFPKAVLDEVKSIKEQIDPSEIELRRDMRNERIITIDGEDSKDLDDAVCVKKLSNGNYLLGVHIADVSHYVREGSELDKETIKRGTSIYIPGKVIPMLPKELSNGICSLNEGVDRLALSIEIEIDRSGNVINNDIYKSIINSKHRMTYTNVYKIVENLDEEVKNKYIDYVPDFNLMKELAMILRKKRFEEGSIDFDLPESKIILNEDFTVKEIKPYEITIANKIIEEFMLIANCTIAQRMSLLEAPFIYRVHEIPDTEKVQTVNVILEQFGLNIKGKNKLHPKAIQQVLDQTKGKENEKIVAGIILRTMKLARYSPSNDGHFGLAFENYCHFTSPIRRYPDLFIHRIISKYIQGNFYNISEEWIKLEQKKAEEYSISSSDTERQAEKIEREIDDIYKAKYMEDKVGEVYTGIVSSITSFGMFAQLENTIEGLIPLSQMNDDYYIYDERKCMLLGERTNRKYTIGQKVTVKLVSVNVQNRQIDFNIYNENEENKYNESKTQFKRRNFSKRSK